MERTATAQDFRQLSPEQQAAHANVLYVCHTHRLSCRCEIVGNKDFAITIAPGLSAAKWWLDRLNIDRPDT